MSTKLRARPPRRRSDRRRRCGHSVRGTGGVVAVPRRDLLGRLRAVAARRACGCCRAEIANVDAVGERRLCAAGAICVTVWPKAPIFSAAKPTSDSESNTSPKSHTRRHGRGGAASLRAVGAIEWTTARGGADEWCVIRTGRGGADEARGSGRRRRGRRHGRRELPPQAWTPRSAECPRASPGEDDPILSEALGGTEGAAGGRLIAGPWTNVPLV